MRSTGHIRQRSPGSWEIRYSLGTDPATGKRRMATTTVKGDRGLLRKSCGGLLRTLDDRRACRSYPLTVREWLTHGLALSARRSPQNA